MNKTLAVFIFIFFNIIFVFAQEVNSGRVKMLQDNIIETQKLAFTNPDKAFSQIDDLMKQVKKERYKEGELALLALQCWYFTNKDLKKAITATQKLEIKAEEYGNVYYKAIVHEYFSSIYVRSELPDKALKESDIAIKLLDQVSEKFKMQDVVSHKVNLYTIANEAYAAKKKPREALQMLLRANKEIKNLEESEKKRFVLKANYTNLAGAYIEFDIDSAEYYVNQSVLLSNKTGKSDIIQFNNNLHLGYIYKRKKDYTKAIYNYKKAESQLPYINSSLENINLIYGDLAEIYKNTDSLERANHYLQKLQHSLLKQEQNKNKSLHKIIDNELLKEKNYSFYIGIGLGIIIILMSVFLFRLQRKNKLLARQEKISEQYLKEHSEVKTVDEVTLSRLMEMVKNGDEIFMSAFHNYFPAFLEKLRVIHPAIVPSEIEFCALLKLNLSTKDIARYKNIEPKSVQNKKYRIRKKLNIADDVDIYFWFNKF